MLIYRGFLGSGAIFCAAVLAACSGGTKATTGGVTGTGGDTSSSTGATGGETTGGTGGAAGTGGQQGTGGGPFMIGPHGAAPQVVNSTQGPVLTSPKVQLIVYASDPVATDADAFVTELGATPTWSDQTAEYGVGAFTKLPTIQIQGTPPTTLNDNADTGSPFQQTMVQNLSGANPAWGAADPNTIYMFLLPLGTDISSGGHCCTDFLGYHWEAQVGSVSVPYGVSCDCAAQQGDPITPLEYVTTTISHELVESATDPYVLSNVAFGQTDDNDVIWSIATGGEVADMCEYNTDSNYQPPGATYMIQRSWSNAAAKAGTNPCVPVATTAPYFNTAAVLTDTVTLSYGASVKTKGVQIPVGQTKTIDVQLFSDAPTTGPWKVTAWDLNDYLGNKANTKVSLDKTSGSNGDTLKLTITVMSYDSSFAGAGFVLESTLDGQDNLSMGAVGN